jgi:hypothetical protein
MSRIFACTPAFIALDFDGTCTTCSFPDIGQEIGATPVLKELVAHNHQLILYTTRVNYYDEIHKVYQGHLDAAVAWFKEREIPLAGINTNPNQKDWCRSIKPSVQFFIDVAALGCPIVDVVRDDEGMIIELPYVDWVAMRKLLVQKQLLPEIPFTLLDFAATAQRNNEFNQIDKRF